MACSGHASRAADAEALDRSEILDYPLMREKVQIKRSPVTLAAVQVALWIGLGGIALIVRNGILFMFYEIKYWLPGVVLVLVFSAGLTWAGWRYSGLPFSNVLGLLAILVGLGLSSTVFKSFPLAELDGIDLGIIVAGGVLICSGFFVLFRLQRNPKTGNSLSNKRLKPTAGGGV